MARTIVGRQPTFRLGTPSNRPVKEIDPTPALPDLVFHVLLALGHGPSHGYAIGQDVEDQSGGRLDPMLCKHNGRRTGGVRMPVGEDTCGGTW